MTQPSPTATPIPAPQGRSWWRTGLTAAGIFAALLGVRVLLGGLDFGVEPVEDEAAGTLYELMASEHRENPAGFETTAATWLNKAAKDNPVTAGFQFDERASVTDLGTALRVVAGMRGAFVAEDGTRRDTEMESRLYYYDRGMSYLIVTCSPGPSACGDRADLVARTEQALLAKLDSPAVEGILPDGLDCRNGLSTAQTRDGGVTCHYPSQVSLSLERKNEVEARELVRSTFKMR